MNSYRRLTREDRIMIQKGLEQGKKKIEIALELGFHRSSVSREVRTHMGKLKKRSPTVIGPHLTKC